MEIEIYVDILFIINFFIIYFIFWIVNKFIIHKVKIKNILFGAFIASFLYLLCIIYLPFKNYLKILLVIFIMLFSIFIAFKPKTIKSFLKLFILVNLVSFSLGGASLAIFYFTNFSNIINGMINFTIENISLKLLLICISISYIFIKISLKWYKKIFIKGQSFYEIIIHKNDKNIVLNALLDTGNNLKEPITKKPVLVVDFFAIQKILTNSLKNILKDEKYCLEQLIEEGFENDIRFIPFKSIGKENGVMVGLKIDSLEIITEKNILIKEAIIAISNFKISKDNSYNALLNPEMLKY